MRHRTIFGKLVYIGDETGEEGREYFTITVQPDGSRTLRALCEMDNDHLIRDVTFSLDEHWKPLECFVRLTIREKFSGSGMFRFFDDRIECEAMTAHEGRISQVIPVSGPIPSFGAHPLCCDTWHSKKGDMLRGQNAFARLNDVALSSPLPNGASGPMAALMDLEIEFVEESTITTRAGTFATKHFKNHNIQKIGSPELPPVLIWAYSDDFIPVKGRFDMFKQTYELVELRIEEGREALAKPMDSVSRQNQYYALTAAV